MTSGKSLSLYKVFATSCFCSPVMYGMCGPVRPSLMCLPNMNDHDPLLLDLGSKKVLFAEHTRTGSAQHEHALKTMCFSMETLDPGQSKG